MDFKKTFIIAEAGVNHNGDVKLAKKLIVEAKKAGASAIKFQTFISEKSISKFAKKAKYQIDSTGNKKSQLEMCQALELNKDEHFQILAECKKHKIEFISTPFDKESIELLISMKVKKIKVASSELNNYPFLKLIAKTKKEIILSTGMGTLKEIKNAINLLRIHKLPKNMITILHCNTEYPTPFEDANLKAIITIKNNLNINVGYSDHTLGIEASLAAVALGAKIIEKHFTLDRKLLGPDHKASIEPLELKNLVNGIRNIEKALGNGIKTPSKSEKKNILIARKSIVANCTIKKGVFFDHNNITIKRPGSGISPIFYDKVLGLKSDRDYIEDELIILKKFS